MNGWFEITCNILTKPEHANQEEEGRKKESEGIKKRNVDAFHAPHVPSIYMWWRRVSAINSINTTADQSWHLPIIISSNAPSWIGNELGVYHRGTDLPVKSLHLPQVEQVNYLHLHINNASYFKPNLLHQHTLNMIPLTILHHKPTTNLLFPSLSSRGFE